MRRSAAWSDLGARASAVTRADDDYAVPAESLRGIAGRFLRFGLLAWGGPIAQIAMLHRELVDRERWVSQDRFNRTLAVYQVLPGPEAQELTVYFGTLARGRIGGLVAGVCFLLPGFLLMLGLSWFYVEIGLASPIAAAAFAGVQACVLALILRGMHRIGTRAVTDRTLLAIAIASMSMTLAGSHFALPLGMGAAVYLVASRLSRVGALLILVATVALTLAILVRQPAADTAHAVPQGVAGGEHAPSVTDLFLSGLRVGSLSFGGAYTAIPFLEEDAVRQSGWMTREQFLDGLALAGIIPAPLVIFATLVGFAGGGLAGAIAITAGMFLPAFALTLVGHTYLEAAVDDERMHAVLYGITAAVIGLVAATIVNLAPAAIGSMPATGIFIGALIGLYLWRSTAATPVLIAASAVAGLVLF